MQRDKDFVQMIIIIFVNGDDLQIKITFENKKFKQQLLIKNLVNDSYQYETKIVYFIFNKMLLEKLALHKKMSPMNAMSF